MFRAPNTDIAVRLHPDHAVTAPVATEQPVRRILVFTIVGLALMMMSIDSTIVATALHTLQGDLHTTINWAGWTITAYSFGFMLMLPITGKLSKRYGHRRIFLASIGVFTLASLCCGLVDNIYALIVCRALQAAGGAGITPSATGLIVDHFGNERDRAVGLFGSIFPVGTMIGPIFGGLFVTYWSWRGVFFVNVPIGIAVIALAFRYVPRDRPRSNDSARAMDLAGMALLGIGILAGMFAASYLGETGARPWSLTFLGPVVLAVAALCGFFRHVTRAAAPFIAPRLISGKGFGAVNLVNILYSGTTGGIVTLVPLYATNRYGINALDSGLLLVAEGLAAIGLSIAATVALRRSGYRLPLYVGCVLIAAGTALLAVGPVDGIPPFVWLAGSAFLAGAGGGTISPPSRNAGLQLAPESSATLAAMRSLFNQVGQIVTVSVATAVLASSADPGGVQAWFYLGMVGVLLVCLPLIARIPEHRGAW